MDLGKALPLSVLSLQLVLEIIAFIWQLSNPRHSAEGRVLCSNLAVFFSFDMKIIIFKNVLKYKVKYKVKSESPISLTSH